MISKFHNFIRWGDKNRFEYVVIGLAVFIVIFVIMGLLYNYSRNGMRELIEIELLANTITIFIGFICAIIWLFFITFSMPAFYYILGENAPYIYKKAYKLLTSK